jgi:Mrp family chromosome partitioning ATPase
MTNPGQLVNGLSVTVPASTYLMQIAYSDPSPYVAQARAEAIARSYVTYRTPRPALGGLGGITPSSAQVNPSATLITAASLPSSPASPSYALDLAVALVLGLALSIGTAAIRDHFDDHLRGPADLEARAGAPVMALIPAFRSSDRAPASRLVLVRWPDSVVAEAYRSLRVRVVRAAGTRRAKTLLVTSPAWEDKGAAAANLAVALAQSGRTTVLICADIRWGRAHEIFGLDSGGGLTDVLTARAGAASALQPTEIPGLRILPPGQASPDPAALQGPAWRAAVAELRRLADFVVVEAPPLLTASDIWPLADLADMILVLADDRASARAQVTAAARELENARGKLIGWMLAGVGRRRLIRAPRLALPPAPAPVNRDPGRVTWTEPDIALATSSPGSQTEINQTHVAMAGQRRDLTESDE